MASRKNNSSKEQVDFTKRFAALWLPYVISGVFVIIAASIPIWHDRNDYDESVSKSTFKECDLTNQMGLAIKRIDEYKRTIDKDDQLILEAIKEKFESHLSNPSICTDQKKWKSIFQELEIVNQILTDE